jgi:hypothetical protein
MNSNSWRDVAARLEAFAEGHYQIQRFSVGEIGDIDKQQLDATYPLMFAIHPNITPVNGALNYALEIVFVDLARDFEEKGTNQVQVISDLARIALDLISEIKNGTVLFGDEVAVVGNQAQIDTGAQQFNNNLCVARLTFSLEIPFEWNACEIPADYAPGGSGQLPGGGYPSWCDKLIYCPVIIQILADLDQKLEFVSVDGVTIVGDGTPGNPLEAVGGGGGGAVDSVNGQTGVVVLGATDVNAWPLPGTGTGPKANGTIEVDPAFNGDLIKQDHGAGGVFGINAQSPTVWYFRFVGATGDECFFAAASTYAAIGVNNTVNFKCQINSFSDLATYSEINIINSNRWNFNGQSAPTVNHDNTIGYGKDSGWVHDGTLYICTDATTGAAAWVAQGGGSGSGTVTSVDLSMPTEFSVSGSPVTTSGTLAVTKANQNANLIYAGPSTGAPAAPTFRNLAIADIAGLCRSQQDQFYSQGTIPSGSTRYLATHAQTSTIGTTIASVESPNPLACTYSHVYFTTNNAQPGTGNLVLTLLVNGVATALVITIPAGSAAGTFSNLVDAVSVAAGAATCWEAVNGTGTSAQLRGSIFIQTI